MLRDSVATRGQTFHDIFNGISIIHRRNLVIEDLKYDNIVRGANGEVKLIDLDDIGPPSKKLKVESGTPIWMAPERWQKEFDQDNETVIGTKSDIYSAGVMLFQAKYYKDVKHPSELDLGVLLSKCCEIKNVSFNFNSRTKFKENLEENLKNYKTAWKILGEEINTRKRWSGAEKREMELIRDMINPDPTLRPNISQVKSRWESIHPREKRALLDFRRIFGQNSSSN